MINYLFTPHIPPSTRSIFGLSSLVTFLLHLDRLDIDIMTVIEIINNPVGNIAINRSSESDRYGLADIVHVHASTSSTFQCGYL